MGASVAAFIVAGLIPLGLVLAGWWDARSVLIFYWAELLVMGFFTMCRILLVQTQPVGLRLLLAMFFYGVFFGLCGAYGAMIAKLVGIHVAAPSSLNYVAIIVTNVRDLMRALQPYGWLALLGLIVSHAVSFFASYVARGEYRGAEIRKLISRLVLRNVILQAAFFAGGMFALRSPASKWAALALVIAKIAADIYAELAAPQASAPAPSATAVPGLDQPQQSRAARRATASIDTLANAPRMEQVHEGTKASLVLDPNPGSLGGDVAGFVDIALVHQAGPGFFVWLDEIGDYRKFSAPTWSEGGFGVIERSAAGTRVKFRFTPPAERRPAGAWVTLPGDSTFGTPPHHVRWQLCVEADDGASWTFEIPVADGAKPSTVFAELPDTGKSGAPPIPANLVYRVAAASALALEEPPQFGLVPILIVMAVGAGIMALMLMASVALSAGVIPFSFGAFLFFGSLYLLGLNVRVEIRLGMLALRKSWCGLSLWSRTFVPADIVAVVTQVSATKPRALTVYATLLRLKAGQDVELFNHIGDSRQAEALRRIVEQRLRGAPDAELEKLLFYRAAS